MAIDHVFEHGALAIRSLDHTRLIQLRLAIKRPGLGGLFSGESLALLVDLHSVALDADLSRVAHSPIRQFSCPDSRHRKWYASVLGGTSYQRALKRPENALNPAEKHVE